MCIVALWVIILYSLYVFREPGLSFMYKVLEWWNWYTRTTQNRVPQGVGVRLSPPALCI